MHLPTISIALCASLAAALPYSGSTDKPLSDKQILKALAGTYSLVNTSR